MAHRVTITYAGRDVSRELAMGAIDAHLYAAAFAQEFGVGAYTLGAATHALHRPIPDSLRKAIEAERRYLTDDDDITCEGLD